MTWILGPDWEANRKRSIDQARSCQKGVGTEHLVPGAVFTHGPSKHTGDRSGVVAIWRVLATNGGHVVLEVAGGDYCRKVGERSVVVISEHEWYPAEHLLEALEAKVELSK